MWVNESVQPGHEKALHPGYMKNTQRMTCTLKFKYRQNNEVCDGWMKTGLDLFSV